MPNLESENRSAFAKHLRTRFISGVIVLVPLAITLFVLSLIFDALTSFVLPVLRPWLHEMPHTASVAVSLVATLMLIYLVGLITAHIVGRRLIQWGEAVILKLPIAKTVYAASKQVIDTFSNSTKAAFKAVVLVPFPNAGSLTVGFVTGTILDPEGKTLCRVFVPTTPNPTSGFLFLVPEKALQFTDISVEDGIKMIVSGGILAPNRYATVTPPSVNSLATAGHSSKESEAAAVPERQ